MCQVLIILATVFALAYGLDISLPIAPTDERIVGGTDASIKDFPYQLSLQHRNYGHICGASIIYRKYALTAAHCVHGFDLSNITLRSGSSIRNEGGTVHNAIRIIIHPYYDPSTLDYDFAIIEVYPHFNLDTYGVSSIQLTNVEPTGGNCSISGWGTTSSGGSSSKQLQSAEVPIVPRATCMTRYLLQFTARMICAGDVISGGKDSCQGDSGGPLVCGGKLAGVVSWGAGCGNMLSPGVYSNVANQRLWICIVTHE